MQLAEFVLEHKEDVWRVPAETRVLKVNCGISLHAATEIVSRCRELDKIIFSAGAFLLAEREAKDYLRAEIYQVTVEEEFAQHRVQHNAAKKIKELYARGDHNLHSLALQFGLTRDEVWQIVHDKALTNLKKEVEQNDS